MTEGAGHTQRAHSPLGPSASHRWMHCPASVRRSQGAPNKSTFFALEGTAAHEFCEHVMVYHLEPSDYLGGIVDLEWSKILAPHETVLITPDQERYWLIDEEMVEGAILYRDTINAARSSAVDAIAQFETKLDMRHIHPNLWGTGDAMVYLPAERHLHVFDYKYGSGIVVDVENNPQLICYAIGAYLLYPDAETVTITVIQPRAFHAQGPVRSQTMDVVDLICWEGILAEAAAKTDRDDAHVEVGDWCKFCPVAPMCAELRNHCLTTLGITPGSYLREKDLPQFTNMTPAELGKVFREAKIIESWLRRFFAYAHEQATAGNIPEGVKLVEKRAYRKWTDPAAVQDELAALGYDEDDFLTERELMTVNQIEKHIGKKEFNELFASFVKKASSGVVLALEGDAREAVTLDKTSAFGAVDDD